MSNIREIEQITTNELTITIYDNLLKHIQSLGDYVVEVKKNSLHITHGRAFLGVHPHKDALLLNIVLDTPITSKRAHKVEQVSKSRYHNEIILASTNDIDDELLSWIQKAYQLTESQ